MRLIKDEKISIINDIISMQHKLKLKGVLHDETNKKELKKLSSGDLLWCYQVTLMLYKSEVE